MILDNVKETLEKYDQALTKMHSIVGKHHADAIELKRRLIKNPDKFKDILDDHALMNKINDALNTDLSNEIEYQISNLLSEKKLLHQQIERAKQPNETFNSIYLSVKEVLILNSKRMDLNLTIQKLKQLFSKKYESLNSLKLESFKQDALRRLERGNKLHESLISFVPSERADNLTELLHNYYTKLVELEKKDKNIKNRMEIFNKIIHLSQNGKILLKKLIPLLKKHQKELLQKKHETVVSLKMALMPEEIHKISTQFFTETGQYLTIPDALQHDQKDNAIEKNADKLLNISISLLALDKWINLFEKRLDTTGIDYFIGEYQNKLGKLDSENIRLDRHIQSISGQSIEALEKLPPEDQPKTDEERLLFLNGEIGFLRYDRYHINKKIIFQLFLTLLAIISLAVLLLKLVNFLFSHWYEKNKDGNPQDLFVQNFLHVFTKFFIWSITIVTLLSSFGFQVSTIIAGLGLGGLAVALAAKETLSNILSGITLFIERPFKIGDVIRINNLEAQEVVNMTWRSTQLVNSNGYYSNVPNSEVANANLINYTKGLFSRDYIDVAILPIYDSEHIANILLQALDHCGDIILQNEKKDIELKALEFYSHSAFIRYRVRFYIKQYSSRGGIRNKVLRQVKRDLEANNIIIEGGKISIKQLN